MSTSQSASSLLGAAHSVVIKVGSSLLVDADAALRDDWLASLANDIVALLAAGKRVTVVSSGAVALGASALASPVTGLALVHKQAAAAVGQIHLAQAWRQALDACGGVCAQVLLTPQDTEDRRRHLNARATLAALAADGIVAIINENDTVATDELRYGDNDRLAARVAQMISADLLILLSDVDGLYDADPALVPGALRIERVTRIDEKLMQSAGDSLSGIGTGGMRSKLAAAAIAMSAGAATVIASGKTPAPIHAIAEGANASVFEASTTALSARRKWILASLRKAATVAVDGGAVAALQAGSSLLPVGVTTISGDFERGDCISICAGEHANVELGVGLASLNSDEARAAIAGARSGERTALLVHRDNLVLHR